LPLLLVPHVIKGFQDKYNKQNQGHGAANFQPVIFETVTTHEYEGRKNKSEYNKKKRLPEPYPFFLVPINKQKHH
jgi:hypothetical protein